MRSPQLLLAVLLLSAARVAADTTTAPVSPDDADQWTLSLSASTYIPRDDGAFVQPTLTADRGWLHLEARYNYEAINSASIWAGYNFSFGDTLTLDFTPMLGGVFGDVTGVAPGYHFAATWHAFQFSSEAEYLFDSGGSSGNYFYCWNEITWSPREWLWFGVAAQRTRLYDSDLDIQPGLLAGFAWKHFNFTGYLFTPGSDDMTVVLTVGIDF